MTAFMNSTKRIGARFSPCFTPQVDLKTFSTFSIVSLIVVLFYSFLRMMMSLSSILLLAKISQSNLRLTVSYALTRSTKITYALILCSLIICRLELTANLASGHPFLLTEPYLYSSLLMVKWSPNLFAIIELIIFEQMSRRAMPLHLFGSERSSFFGNTFRMT